MVDANGLGGLLGGILIGLSAVWLLLGAGRIAGIAGIVGGLLQAKTTDKSWRIVFLLGLLSGAGLYGLWQGGLVIVPQTNTMGLIVGGLLVGIGVRLGSGCTSGHGVCGLARRSPRSLVATLLFMVIAMLTVLITHHLLS